MSDVNGSLDAERLLGMRRPGPLGGNKGVSIFGHNGCKKIFWIQITAWRVI